MSLARPRPKLEGWLDPRMADDTQVHPVSFLFIRLSLLTSRRSATASQRHLRVDFPDPRKQAFAVSSNHSSPDHLSYFTIGLATRTSVHVSRKLQQARSTGQ